jgi:hypothetical protein
VSNYLLIVAERPRREAIDQWLRMHAGPGEVHHVNLRGRRRLTIVAPRVQEGIRGTGFFRGVAVTENSIIYGAKGWAAASATEADDVDSHSGGFVAAQWGHKSVTVDRDVYGNVRLLTTAVAGLVAVSDSLLVLGSLRRDLGAPLTLDHEVLHSRSVLNLIAAQQLSPETLFREITFVPAGHGVTIVRDCAITHGATLMARVEGETDYGTAVRAAAVSIARTTSAAAAATGWTAELSLSGGYDSRVVYSAGRVTNAGIAATSRRTSSVHDADYAVARDLTNHFGSRFGREGPVEPDGPPDSWLTTWGAAHLAVYDGFGTGRTRRWRAKTVNLNGLGAETAKGNWGYLPWNDLVHAHVDRHDKHVTSVGVAAFTELGRRGIVSVGGDPESPAASELLFLGYRCGMHGSAGQISINMTSLMPLQDMKLTRLGYTPRGRKANGDDSIIVDLSILLDLDVATFRYDLPARNLSRSYAEERLAVLGGPVRHVGQKALLGSPDDVPDGPTHLSLSIARSIGLEGAYSADDILLRADDDIDLLPTPELRDTYRLIAKNARWMIGVREGDLLSAGVSPPKTASLAALRLLT